jgi:hypothetical protein
MQMNTDDDGINLVIFDADNSYPERLKEISEWKQKFKLEFEIFLFPNNSDSGALEDLLEGIINPLNQPIFDCWDKFEACINSKSIKGRSAPLTIPAKKTKIYGYLETLLGTSHSEKEKIKDRNRNYLELEHWNLKSDKLKPLNEFLKSYFQ